MFNTMGHRSQGICKTISFLRECDFPIRIVVHQDIRVVLQPEHGVTFCGDIGLANQIAVSIGTNPDEE